MEVSESGLGLVLTPSFLPPKSLHAQNLSQHDFIHSLLCLEAPWKPPTALQHNLEIVDVSSSLIGTQDRKSISFVDDVDISPELHVSQLSSSGKKRAVDVDLTDDIKGSKKVASSSFDASQFNLFDGTLTYQAPSHNTTSIRSNTTTVGSKHPSNSSGIISSVGDAQKTEDDNHGFDGWRAPPVVVPNKGFRSMNTSMMKASSSSSAVSATGGKKSMFGSLLKASSSKVMSLLQDDDHDHNKKTPTSHSSAIRTVHTISNTINREVSTVWREASSAVLIGEDQVSTLPPKEKAHKPLPSLQALLSSAESTSSRNSNKEVVQREKVSQAIPVDIRVSTFFPEGSKQVSDRTAKSSSSANLRDSTVSFQIDDFKGIQQLCRNAGATQQGLQAFLRDCLPPAEQGSHSSAEKTVSMALLFQDLSSNHATFSIKYCTPTSSCHHWYCTCDRHVRAEAIRKHLVGALVLLPAQFSADGADRCYFLPLTCCVEAEEDAVSVLRGLSPDYKQDLQHLPLRSETTVSQRWDALFQLLYHPRLLKVFYHTQVSLLPIIYAWNHTLALKQDHVEMFPQLYDVKIAEYLLNTDADENALELFALFEKYGVDVNSATDSSHTFVGQVSRSIAKVKDELVALLALFKKQNVQIEHHQLSILLHQIEMPTSCLLSAMELHGVHVNLQQYDTLRQSLQRKLQHYEEEVYKLSGFQFNVASPEQVAHVLYDKLKLNPESAGATGGGSTTASGKFTSTSEESLLKILHLHPVVQQILNYRSIMKLLSTYIDGIKPLLTALESRSAQRSSKLTNRLHAYWNQTSTRTGRLSCCKPNLQNIPGNQTIDGVEYSMRALFVSSPNKVLITADYSQIEMRILAHVSNDAVMCSLFQHDGDVYRILAGKIMNKACDKVEDEERNRAKVICLGVLYGMGPQAAAARLGIDVATASKITNSFFNNFPQVKSWIQRVKLLAKQHCHVKTIIGRTRLLPDINASDAAKKSAAERQAVNSIIQGSASDLIKYAMIACVAEIKKWECSLDRKPLHTYSEVKLVMQIHDELIFEVPNTDDTMLHNTIQLIKDVMEKAVRQKMNLKVPLIANISVGPTWGDTQAWQPSTSATASR